MRNAPVTYTPIGVIHTPFPEPRGAPIQPVAGQGVRGIIKLDPQYVPALKDLDGFSHIVLLYHLHRAQGYELQVTPFLDTVKRGLFATRAPRRPNPIGLSIVRLERIEGARLYILDVDIVDGTPLLDIKPYVPAFLAASEYRVGWLTGKDNDAAAAHADTRFLPDPPESS